MNISQLKLRDYRCFESLEIDFHPQLTVLVANNGAGKSSILDALAVALGPFVSAFDEGVGRNFLHRDIRQYVARSTYSNEVEYANEGARLEAYAYLPQSEDKPRLISWQRGLTGASRAKTTTKDAKALIDYAKCLQEAVRRPFENTQLPLVAYYGTGRLYGREASIQPRRLERTSRTVVYADCLEPDATYRSFIDWFWYWSFNAKHALVIAMESYQPLEHSHDNEFRQYVRGVSNAINTCVSTVGWSDVEYSFSREALVANHPEFGQLPVDMLSDGIRGMISMVADIAFRATKLNGHLGERAPLETPGIVLIDEIDMHLHPQWQQVILDSLTQAFPKIQFIVTTHSPQVVSTAAAESLRVLHNDFDPATGKANVSVSKVAWQTRGVASPDVLAHIMEVNPVPDVPEAEWINEYQALIQQNLHEASQGKRLRKKLEHHFGLDHPLIRECDRIIRLQRIKQKLPRDKNAGDR